MSAARLPGIRMPRGTATCVVLCLASLLTAGCLMPAGTPLQHTYQLNAELPSPGGDTPAFSTKTVLLVERPQANPGFATARMAYLERPHELQYFAVNEWADSPARMLLPLLVETLQQQRTWQAVIEAPSAVPADYRLVTEHVLLQHEFTEKPSRIRVGWRMQLIAVPSQRVVGTRRFEAVHEAPSDDPYGGVVAANRAVMSLLQDVIQWLDAQMNAETAASNETPVRKP